MQTVTAYDDYDYVIAESDVPATKTVTETNRITGEPEEVICNLTGIHPAGMVMANNTMTVTFTNYDAAYYEWNGNYIPRNDEIPPLSGYEAQLLENAGAAAGSIITGYSWNGDAYLVNGVLCRDAIANVQQPVQMYRAEYSGVIQIPKETVYKAIYETEDVDGAKEYTVKATAVYAEKKTVLPYILTGAGILILIGAVIAILMMLSKKEERRTRKIKEKNKNGFIGKFNRNICNKRAGKTGNPNGSWSFDYYRIGIPFRISEGCRLV